MFLDFSDSINNTWAEKSNIIIVHDRIMSFMSNVSLKEKMNCKYSSSYEGTKPDECHLWDSKFYFLIVH